MIYRKLKDYIHKKGNVITTIFGDLTSKNVVYYYQTEDGTYKEFYCYGTYTRDYDFLYDYYVMGIHPKYKIEHDKIIPYLSITLDKKLEELGNDK